MQDSKRHRTNLMNKESKLLMSSNIYESKQIKYVQELRYSWNDSDSRDVSKKHYDVLVYQSQAWMSTATPCLSTAMKILSQRSLYASSIKNNNAIRKDSPTKALILQLSRVLVQLIWKKETQDWPHYWYSSSGRRRRKTDLTILSLFDFLG